MAGVETIEVDAEEAGLRLDRWFHRRYPDLGHGRLEKLLRTGQVRVDGARAKAAQRLTPGQRVRVPPLGAPPSAPPRPAPAPVPERDAAELIERVLYRDDLVIALDKPAGLAVQGGSGTRRHLDGMLDALRFGSSERPRLVHRLDRDTSGVLLLARTAQAAAAFAAVFKAREAAKLYWAVVVGVPKPSGGRLDLALDKRGGPGRERVRAGGEGRRAVTLYHTVETAGRRAAWLALMPLTGRTHQLRAHCAALGTPILGDAKYGGAEARLTGEGARLARKLHLHARELVFPHPDGRWLRVVAPLPPHMAETWRFFGFAPELAAELLPEDMAARLTPG